MMGMGCPLLQKLFLYKALQKAPRAIARIYSLVLVLFGWWLFVFDDMPAGFVFLGKMFGSAPFTRAAVNLDALSNLLLLAVLAVASTPLPKKLYYKLYEKSAAARWVAAGLAVAGGGGWYGVTQIVRKPAPRHRKMKKK